MANKDHLALLHGGVDRWNEWRSSNPAIQPDLSDAKLLDLDLSRANLDGANLRGADLSKAQLSHASLHGADLEGATLILADLLGAVLNEADLSGVSFFGAILFGTRLKSTNMSGANLLGASLMGADLSGANLTGAHLMGANFQEADLTEANLEQANLTAASLVGTRVKGARFVNCSVHGISAWNLEGEPAVQKGLIVTPKGEPAVIVGDLELAMLVNLLLYGKQVLKSVQPDSLKLALLTMSRRADQQSVAVSIQEVLAKWGLLPVLIDWDRRISQDTLKTIKRLSTFSGVLIVDMTTVRSGPQIWSLATQANPAIRIQPLLEASADDTIPEIQVPKGGAAAIRYRDSENLVEELDRWLTRSLGSRNPEKTG